MRFLGKILGDQAAKELKKKNRVVEKINQLEETFKVFSDAELQNRSFELKQQVKDKKPLDDVLPEAFALVRESAKRKLGQRHYDVQLIGGMVLHEGKIAEMKTGEGKTLAATLAAFLNGLSGQGCHIVTVNDYLAKRDAVWMGQIYHALGLSVGCLTHEATYLYTSAPQAENLKSQISNLKSNKSGALEEIDKKRDQEGGFRVEEDFLRPCSRKEAYAADITYGTNNEFGFDYLRDNLVFDLQEKTQRGFHFAIVDEVDSILIDEARTPLIISSPDEESSKYYQDFAKIVPLLKKDLHFETDEKMKSAFLTEKGVEEVERILGVANIYEQKGMRYLHYLEQALRAEAFFQKDRDYLVKNNEVIIIDEFTGRIMPGRRWSGGLHQAIEAKEGVKIQPESKILATITFQNYFRMYQKLAGMTGTALSSAEEFDKVYKLEVASTPTNKPLIRKSLPDMIYKTEQVKFKAVVSEIKARHQKGQPVLIGTRSVERNEYLSRLLSREGIKHEVLNAKNHQREGEIIAQAGRKGAVTVATNMAGRGVDIMLGGVPPSKFKVQSSKFKVAEENICNKDEVAEDYRAWEGERNEVLALAGLHVIGTERHEARRIDNQLRGRAGRQGDPGSSQFFVSLEDELLRIFGGDKIKRVMGFLKIPEDQPIEAKIISSAIEKAQERVEGLNFDSRKYVLDFDDVISKQRNKIYSQRNRLLAFGSAGLKDFVLETLKNVLAKIVFFHQEELEKVFDETKTIMPLEPTDLAKIKELAPEPLIEFLSQKARGLIEEKQKKEGQENLQRILMFVCLKAIDFFWTEHLVDLEHLKDSVRLRAYGGKDPLVEYKTESHKMFQALWDNIEDQISRTVFKLSLK